jgi:hypothetical protein
MKHNSGFNNFMMMKQEMAFQKNIQSKKIRIFLSHHGEQ